MAKKQAAKGSPPETAAATQEPPATTQSHTEPVQANGHAEVPSDTNGTAPETNGEANKPVKVVSLPVAKDTYVQASIWERTVTLKGGETFTTHEVSVRKRYKVGEEWKSAHSFRASELYAVSYVVRKAEEYILDLRAANCPF